MNAANQARPYGSRRPVVLDTTEPAMGKVRLGKISQLYPLNPARWAYLNNVTAQMRKHQEFGIAPCVVSLMQAWQIPLILYYDRADHLTYHIILGYFLEKAVLKAYSYRPPYYHIGLQHFGRFAGQHRSKFTTNVLELEWETPEIVRAPSAHQLALSF